MTEKKADRTFLRTPEATLAYSYIHTPDTEGQYADGKFKATLVFDGDAPIDTIREKAIDAAVAKNPKLKRDKVNVLIKDGDDIEDKEGNPKYPGKFVLTAKSKYAPQVVDSARKALPDSVKLGAGDVVKAIIEAVPSDVPIKGSVAFRLMGIQLITKNSSGGNGHDYSGMFDIEDSEGFGAAPEGNSFDDDLPF